MNSVYVPESSGARQIIEYLRRVIARIMTDDKWHPTPDDEAPDDWWPVQNFNLKTCDECGGVIYPLTQEPT